MTLDAGIWRFAAFFIATLTPLLFTPFQGGTDIFLWAIVPWVIAFMCRAGAGGPRV